MFNSLVEMIEHFKNNDMIEGILEYGSKHYYEKDANGDYDLTIITTEKVFTSLAGVHFYVQNTPVDCMIKSLSDFYIEKPSNKFDYVHLDADILFDRSGKIAAMLRVINEKWKIESELPEREISRFRFTLSHVINKLNNRILKEEYYMFCCHIMASAISHSLDCYCRLYNLPFGKPLLYFNHMKENNHKLYSLYQEYYNARALTSKFKLLKSIINILLANIGGIWKEGEVIYHLGNTDSIPEPELKNIKEIIPWLTK